MPDAEVIAYQFTFADDTSCAFSVELRHPSLELVSAPTGGEPEWTALTFRKCPNCLLNADDNPHCPVARNLVPIAEAFHNRMSYDEVEVTVRGETRHLQRSCPVPMFVSNSLPLLTS